ncbi:unnamed protein product [Nezara viridula]|uniref:Uncharacterized protein n=1 Tax=Nezara viridula TaxID=85310 RepID=A0A9P0HU43_NEZVI|nr:unnamed protein product [Nezara viridula]
MIISDALYSGKMDGSGKRIQEEISSGQNQEDNSTKQFGNKTSRKLYCITLSSMFQCPEEWKTVSEDFSTG